MADELSANPKAAGALQNDQRGEHSDRLRPVDRVQDVAGNDANDYVLMLCDRHQDVGSLCELLEPRGNLAGAAGVAELGQQLREVLGVFGSWWAEDRH